MGMTWSRFKHIMLTFLIGLSLFLSFQLWTAGGELREPTSSGSGAAPASLVDRTLTEVFAPNQIIWHRSFNNTKFEANTFYTQEWIEEHFSTMSFGEVNSPQRLSQADYQQQLATGEWVEFVFDAPVPFGLFEDAFEDLPTDYENRTFMRFYMNRDEPELLGFYDVNNEINYTVEDTSFTTDIINELLYTANNQFNDVEAVDIGDTFIYLPIEEVEVEYHDYLVERLPNNLYINQFFTDTSEVDARRTGQSIRYIDLTTEVRINDATNTLTYLRQRSDLGQMTFSQRLLDSFQELRQIENWTETIHYQSYTPSTNEVTFQRYIQGYPVYSFQQLESSILVTVVEGGRSNLRLPLRVVQTPLTLTGNDSKTLPSGRTVIEQLENTEDGLTTIQDIKVGLTWIESEEDSRVIHFEPNWYVQSENVWYELNRFIQLQEESHNGL
ncbi:YycH family regulatory protein [Alkalibacterium olivapovliticus]|nr:two-component system activity regulator YycH [Alkalibacterium olivapovliticus]